MKIERRYRRPDGSRFAIVLASVWTAPPVFGRVNRQSSAYGTALKLAILIPMLLVLGNLVARGQVANHRVPRSMVRAASSDHFLSSLGVNTHVDQGVSPETYVEPLQYTGIRNIRDGYRNLAGYLMLRDRTGVRVGLVGSDVGALMSAAKALAARNALLAIEGPNEPNNFMLTYNGQLGGGDLSWVPVAELQKDLYRAVKADASLRRYPVLSVSEPGAQTENAGLQFLTIPKAADSLLPPGTRYADFANCHNYVSGNGDKHEDNQAWHAADPVLDGRWDGLFANFGVTWRKKFKGYSNEQLHALPRVTTETGWDSTRGRDGERTQGTILTNTYLAQYARGWRYTFIYQLRDNEGGVSTQGLYREDGTPKPAATYIHNLTSILADKGVNPRLGSLHYTIEGRSDTTHDLLLQKLSGRFFLVVWGEQIADSTKITISFPQNFSAINIYDITSGTAPVQVIRDAASITLAIADHALILELVTQ